MMMKSTHDSPILVTGAADATGAGGRNLTAMLLAKRHKVRALVRREDERAGALRRLGAEVVQGDLTDPPRCAAPSKVGTDTKGLKRAADGSIIIPIQVDPPQGDEAANWLPSPKGNFYVILRLYQPSEEILTGKYQLPQIRKVQ